MSAVPVVPILPARPVPVPVDGSSMATPPPSFWDRASTWVSENKAVVYTAGAVAIVITGAGVAYYLSQPNRRGGAGDGSALVLEEKKKSKKDRRKAKKQTEELQNDEAATLPTSSSP